MVFLERNVYVEKIRLAAHSSLDYSEYSDPLVRQLTNCYAHAIGVASTHMGIRIGELCGKKPVEEKYISTDEIDELFKADMKAIKLECRKIKRIGLEVDKEDVFNFVRKHKFKDNEFLIMIFAIQNGDLSIRDFHFWRYDKNGFTEKRFWNNLIKIENPQFSWPEGILTRFVGAYLMKR